MPQGKAFSNALRLKNLSLSRRRSGWPFQDKLLYSFAGVHFAGIQIPLRIRYYLMHPMKLSCVPAVVSRLPHDAPIPPSHGPNHIVLSVSDQQKFLMFVDRKRELPNRSHSQGLHSQRQFGPLAGKFDPLFSGRGRQSPSRRRGCHGQVVGGPVC